MSEKLDVTIAWPSGDSMPVLATKLTLEALGQRCPLLIFRDRDDLDWFTGAVVRSTPSGPVLIMRHDNNPYELTAFYVDSAQSLDVAHSVIVKLFNLSVGEVAWRAGEST